MHVNTWCFNIVLQIKYTPLLILKLKKERVQRKKVKKLILLAHHVHLVSSSLPTSNNATPGKTSPYSLSLSITFILKTILWRCIYWFNKNINVDVRYIIGGKAWWHKAKQSMAKEAVNRDVTLGSQFLLKIIFVYSYVCVYKKNTCICKDPYTFILNIVITGLTNVRINHLIFIFLTLI